MLIDTRQASTLQYWARYPVPAPNKEVYEKTCNPTIADGWEKIKKSLEILGKFNRKTVRLTLAKGLNMVDAAGYAELLKDVNFDFLEFKAYMWVGHSQKRMKIEDMASHEEIKAFAQQVCDLTGWKIADEAVRSRCVLVVKKDRPDRIMKFD